MITIRGSGLTIKDIALVARGEPVELTRDATVRERIESSRRIIVEAVESDKAIYGVTTLFGGMAHRAVPKQLARELSTNAIWSHKTTTGDRLPAKDVRAAMLLRANSLLHGISGVRFEILERFVAFLNANALPHVFELGSIGASGDLVPLAYIAGALLGVDREYKVDIGNETLDSHRALAQLGLEPLPPEPKEGLALVNGTSVSTAVAANCIARAQDLLQLSFALHALYIQALLGTDQSFHPFIHEHKPHPGQLRAAREMVRLLKGSRLIHDESSGDRQHRQGALIQDRYSLRCLPQYLGPIVDGLDVIARQVEIEANSANDNPLIDPATGTIYHCGNFLAQYTAVAMDQLRYFVGLLAKHLDVQIALLVMPEFSNGLPASLIANPDRAVNVGFKSLQVVNHSIMPLLTYYGTSLADRFPTHAEQFNQNINSQAMGSANLARRSLDLFEHYLANALLFAVQAIELRTQTVEGHYDARRCLSPATARVYEVTRNVIGKPIGGNRPLIWNDNEQSLEPMAERLLTDLRHRGLIVAALRN